MSHAITRQCRSAQDRSPTVSRRSLFAISLALWCSHVTAETNSIPEPMPVPRDVRETFRLDSFYQQWIDVGGLPVVASPKVNPYAMKEAAWLIVQMIGHRPDLLHALARNGVRFAVMAYDELTTDIPEHSDLVPDYYWDRRARGLGATQARPATSCGEENLLNYPGDPYWNENILIHEFSHAIHEMGLSSVDPSFDDRLASAFSAATSQGLWRNTYAITNKEEYWAEGTQSWFDTNREHDDEHNHVDTRNELKVYDPELAKLLTEVYGDTEWRYTPATARTNLPFLRGFDPEQSPVFEWPSDLEEFHRALRDPGSDGGREWVNLRLYDPDRVRNPRSQGGSTETEIIFVNLTASEISFHWVDYNGKEVYYGSIAPNGFSSQSTYRGHVWAVKDASGRSLALFRAEGRTGRALVRTESRSAR